MNRIRFRFDPEKLVHALAFFSTRGVTGLDAMKAAKLLYFADKLHLQKYGRPILGDDYYCMKHGPIPTVALNIIQSTIAGDDEADTDLMAEYFDVTPGKHPQLVAKKSPDEDVFSDSDIEVLNEIIENYGGKNAWQLREIAHEQPDVKAADARRLAEGKGSVPMSFESFIAESRPSMLPLLEEDQESRAFVQSLTW
jgi:uncharacterized phage-associated protein